MPKYFNKELILHPELNQTIIGMQNAIIAIMEDLSVFNYGSASMKLRQLYAQLAVQSSLLNTNLDEIDGNGEPVIIDCILSDAELEGGCE
jgi:hypothetical protein